MKQVSHWPPRICQCALWLMLQPRICRCVIRLKVKQASRDQFLFSWIRDLPAHPVFALWPQSVLLRQHYELLALSLLIVSHKGADFNHWMAKEVIGSSLVRANPVQTLAVTSSERLERAKLLILTYPLTTIGSVLLPGVHQPTANAPRGLYYSLTQHSDTVHLRHCSSTTRGCLGT